MEKQWQAEFGFSIEREWWENIYRRNCLQLFDRKLSEFKFKLLHNLLACKEKLYKWKIDMSEKCRFCNIKENTKHQLFSCEQVSALSKTVGNMRVWI